MRLVADQQNIAPAVDGVGKYGAVFVGQLRSESGRKETTYRFGRFERVEQYLEILQRCGKLRLPIPAGWSRKCFSVK
jgi:hypothetical protein